MGCRSNSTNRGVVITRRCGVVKTPALITADGYSRRLQGCHTASASPPVRPHQASTPFDAEVHLA